MVRQVLEVNVSKSIVKIANHDDATTERPTTEKHFPIDFSILTKFQERQKEEEAILHEKRPKQKMKEKSYNW